ncbi:MAG: hypothetical protein KAJ46_01865, partial [Sedimentisphaerales bacterium]|nr:hypothetical protein [Sedimentisphaerales bacterium]
LIMKNPLFFVFLVIFCSNSLFWILLFFRLFLSHPELILTGLSPITQEKYRYCLSQRVPIMMIKEYRGLFCGFFTTKTAFLP